MIIIVIVFQYTYLVMLFYGIFQKQNYNNYKYKSLHGEASNCFYRRKLDGALHNLDSLVHLQLLPEGALRFTKHRRESEHPPLFI